MSWWTLQAPCVSRHLVSRHSTLARSPFFDWCGSRSTGISSTAQPATGVSSRHTGGPSWIRYAFPPDT